MASNLIQTTELIERANKVLSAHATELNKSAVQMEALNKQYTKLPSEYIKALQDNAKAEKAIAQAKQATLKVEKDIADVRAKEARALKAELDLKNKKTKAEKQENKEITSKIPTLRQLANLRKQEQRLLEKSQGLYNRVQRGINEVTKEYQNLAIRKELNGKLSAEQEVTLGKLEAKLNKYNAALKKVDANIGKHTRNVGNYKSGFDGLGFSIAQLTREAPAFAVSMQTGFLALSNNIPILFDELQKLRVQNKALAADGKATQSVFKSLGRAIFSFHTLISAGVLILTLYGDKIFSFVAGLFGANNALDGATKAQELYNKKLIETRGNLGLEITQLRALTEIVKDETISRTKRNEALQVLQDKYPDYFKNLDLDKLKSNQLKTAIDEITKSLENKAKMQAAENVITESYKKLIEEQITLTDQLQTSASIAFSNQRRDLKEQIRLQEAVVENLKNQSLPDNVLIDQQDKLNKLKKNLEDYRLANRDAFMSDYVINEVKKQTEGIEGQYEKSVKILKQILLDAPSILDLFTGGKTTRQFKSEAQDINKVTEDTFGILEGTIPYYEAILQSLKEQQTQLSRTREEWLAYQQQIDEFEGKLNTLKTTLQGFGDNETNALSGALVGAVTPNETEKPKQSFQQLFNSYVSIAQNAFGIINQLSQNSLQKQLNDLEAQKENALQFAGDSLSAREEIERQYDERRAKIQRKQAEAQKTQAIFNTVINTAQGIVSALGMFPPNPVLASLIGAIGAAQLAVIQSQPIPQFWQGGEVGGSQQIMVNDDPYGKKGRNYKEVIEKPNGQILTPQGKNVKMTVPKGTIVHPTYDAFINSLDNELLSNNIMPIGTSNIMPMIVNNGLTKGEIMDVMQQHGQSVVKAINNKESFVFSYDERGVEVRRKKQGKISKVMNARYTGRGLGV